MKELLYLTLICKTEHSNKFWTMIIPDTPADYRFDVKYGRIGTSGQEGSKIFTSPEDLLKAAKAKIAEKHKKGYQVSSDKPRAKHILDCKIASNEYLLKKLDEFFHSVSKYYDLGTAFNPLIPEPEEIPWTKHTILPKQQTKINEILEKRRRQALCTI